MKYQVFFQTSEGKLSPHGPAPIWATGIVDAQAIAQNTLDDMQSEGKMEGWSIFTVVETVHGL